MENFSINFLVEEIKNKFKNDVFLSKIKLKKDFLEFKLGKKILCFPMRNRFAPFFAKNAGFESNEVAGPDVNILRKYLEQSKLMVIDKPFEERVVTFTFSKTMIWGERKNFSFIVDAGAVPVKWYIVDENMQILYNKNDSNAISGTKYQFPSDKRESIFSKTKNEISDLNNFRDVINSYKGFGPVFAKELFEVENKSEFLEKLKETDKCKGYLYKKDIFPFLLESQNEEPIEFNDMSEAIFNRLFLTVEDERFTRLRGKLLKKTEDLLKKKEILNEKLVEELKYCENANKFSHIGELLSSNYHKLKKGLDKVILTDFVTEEEVEIPLNPAFHPETNISFYYNKATKATKKKQYVKERVFELKAEINSLKDKTFLLENVEKYEELEEFEEQKQNKKVKKVNQQTAGLVRLNLENGFIIYAGKTSDANHYIYTRKLTEKDLWFHAKDIPGSHVVLKCPDNFKITDKHILIAAEIAAYYSKERLNNLVEIQYTTKANLYSSKGKGKAFVLLRKFKTINVKPNQHTELQEQF